MNFTKKPDDMRSKLTRTRSVLRLSALEEVFAIMRPGERLALYALAAALAASALFIVSGLNAAVSVTVPVPRGSLSEGIVGSPRFINPILAISPSDEDMTGLLYSGLTRVLPDGTIVPDLAQSWTISPDGTVYTFTLRDDLSFHDGAPLTSSDVLFTVQAAQNPEVKSPRRADWEGVAVSSPDEKTIVFTLQKAYAPFLENTSLGILPKHLWENVQPAEFPFSTLNTRPVGSGPYRLLSSETDETGAAQSVSLAPFRKFTMHEPYVQKLTFQFYPNETERVRDFNARRVQAIAGVAPSDLASMRLAGAIVVHVPLPRVFGVFFNQGHAPVLGDMAVRAALDAAVDKRSIVDSVLKGYGTVLDGPVPPGIWSGPSASADPVEIAPAASSTEFAQKARSILSKGGWSFDESAQAWKKKKQTLAFSLATGDAPELAATAQLLADFWRAAGIEVSVQMYPLSELNTSIIRPRNYDAILFGEVIGRTPDLFAFWHSSQRNDPGLNLALYANAKADSLLSRARATTDASARESLYRTFTEEIRKDKPAVFLYSPEFLYVVPDALRGVKLGALTTPSERFLNVYDWFVDTEEVWSAFTDEVPQDM